MDLQFHDFTKEDEESSKARLKGQSPLYIIPWHASPITRHLNSYGKHPATLHFMREGAHTNIHHCYSQVLIHTVE